MARVARPRPKGAGHAKRPPVRRNIRLIAANGVLFRQAAKPDLGPDERAFHQGGVVLGFRRLENGATVKAAWARAPGQIEHLEEMGLLGTGADRWRRGEAAKKFRTVVARAQISVTLSSGYGLRVRGADSADEEAEKRQQDARKRMGKWGVLIGFPVLWLLLDTVVLEVMPHPRRVSLVVWALDRIADDYRL